MITILVLDGHGNVVKEDLPKIEIKQIPAKAREPQGKRIKIRASFISP